MERSNLCTFSCSCCNSKFWCFLCIKLNHCKGEFSWRIEKDLAPNKKRFFASVWIQGSLWFIASLLMASGGDAAHCHAGHGAMCLWSTRSAHWSELHQISTGERIKMKTLLSIFQLNLQKQKIFSLQIIQGIDVSTQCYWNASCIILCSSSNIGERW